MTRTVFLLLNNYVKGADGCGGEEEGDEWQGQLWEIRGTCRRQRSVCKLPKNYRMAMGWLVKTHGGEMNWEILKQCWENVCTLVYKKTWTYELHRYKITRIYLFIAIIKKHLWYFFKLTKITPVFVWYDSLFANSGVRFWFIRLILRRIKIPSALSK